MQFNTLEYFYFLTICVSIYYIIPPKWQNIWLLACSYFFYACWNVRYIFLIFTVTINTYAFARLINNRSEAYIRKLCLTGCIIINLFLLGYFKYAYMIMEGINGISGLLANKDIINLDAINIILPMGISFFVLQSIGYVIDVYRKSIVAENNLATYALFIALFPQLVAGPIERSKSLLSQIKNNRKFFMANFQQGGVEILYGLLLKMVIADRCAILVDTVFSDLSSYNIAYIIVATFFFTLQIYCDFYAYSIIAKGSASLLGIRLMDNFLAPYYSESVTEFWSRWHISLSSWFRDYLYIPLGGNRKGTLKKYINIIITFCISGLWHGASVTFLVWGLLHGIARVFDGIIGLKYVRNPIVRTFRRVLCFVFVSICWFIFRVNRLSDVFKAFSDLSLNIDSHIFTLGVSKGYMIVISFCLIAVCVIDIFKYLGMNVTERFLELNFYLRMPIEILTIIIIMIFGCYGASYDVNNFIYFEF